MTRLDKIKKLRNDHLKTKHNLEWYDYQLEVSDRIIEAVYDNMSLTTIEGLQTIEIPVEFSRQSGKTTTIVHTVEFIMVFFPAIFRRGIEIGIFAPQNEQAKTDFKRLKDALSKSRKDLLVFDPEETRTAKEESNAKTLVLANGAVCYIFPITPTSSPESKTLDLMIFEEAQGLTGEREEIMRTRVWPMGASTNAPRVYIGTAGTQLCYFLTKIESGEAMVLDCDKIIEYRQRTYERTGDIKHLIYESFINNERKRLGEHSDDFRMPYKLEWITAIGMFLTQPQLLQCRIAPSQIYPLDKMEGDYFFGLDTAKENDQTVLKIGKQQRSIGSDGTSNDTVVLVDSFRLKGINYQDQFDAIRQKLQPYNIKAGAIDSTGQGDFMPDLFERGTGYKIFRVKFSLQSKDEMYKKLFHYVTNEKFKYIQLQDNEEFERELLNLVKEYKGIDSQYLSVHHPETRDAHDDHADSLALMVLLMTSYTLSSSLTNYLRSNLTEFMKEQDGTLRSVN